MIDDFDNIKDQLRCCVVQNAWTSAHNDLLGIRNEECDMNAILMNAKFRIIDKYIEVGTVLYYDLDVCSLINLTSMLPLLADNMKINININSSAGVTIILTITGDFLGFTLTQFIDALVLQINTYTTYTATNANPSINICFDGTSSIDLIDATISIEIAAFYFLKWTEDNSRRIAATTLGYGAIGMVRPTYVGTTATGVIHNKLYVPNGDRIDYIYPSTIVGVPPAGDNPPAGATSNSITKDFTGALGETSPGLNDGTAYSTVISPFLSTNFFQAGQEFEFFATVTDDFVASGGIRGQTINGVLTGANYANAYRLRFRITDYNFVPGSGVLNYRLVNWEWQSGVQFPATPFPSLTAIDAPYTPIYPPAYGTTGGTAIGNRIWTFEPSQLGWSTVSIFSCDLVSGNLTWIKDLEINVNVSADSSYNKHNEHVYVSGFGADLRNAGVVKIDPVTDLQVGVVDILITYNLGLRWNPVTYNNYVFTTAGVLAKVGENLEHDPAANKTISCGSIAFDINGGVYIASISQLPLVVYWISNPEPLPLSPDPTPILKFTALDNTTGAPTPNPFPYNYNLPAIAPGITYPALAPLFIGGGLDIYGLIWLAGATFQLTYIDTTSPPAIGTKYTLFCTVVSYNNATGELRYTINIIQTEIPPISGAIDPTLTSFPLTGNRNWTWANYPSILGAIAIHYHDASKKLFISRATNFGGLLQSYDMYDSSGVLLTEAQIQATRVNYFPPNYTTIVLSGQLNYQEIEDKFFMPITNGSEIYVFDPNTLTWDIRPVDHTINPPQGGGDPATTGGLQYLSYTADETLRNAGGGGINIYGDTPNGNEVGVIDYEPENANQFTGKFTGDSTEVVTDDSMNCSEEELIEKAINDLKEKCGCPPCGTTYSDINPPPSDNNVTLSNVYYGRSILTTLTAAEVQALTATAKSSFAGVYGFAADAVNGYCFVAYPSSWGVPASVVDPTNGFDIALNTVFNVTIGSVQYSVYRSFNELFGAVQFQFNQ